MGTSILVAYVWSAVILVVFMLVAILLANAVPYQPDGSDKAKRKLWFWIMCAFTPVVAFAINLFISSGIMIPTMRSSYIANAAIGAGAAFVLFILLGIFFSKTMSRTKLLSWF